MIDNKESSRGVNDLKTRAIIALQEGNLAEAEALLKSALDLCHNKKEKAERLHDLGGVKKEEAELLHGLGDLAVRQGNLVLAEQYLADALAKYRTLKNRLKEAHILLYLGRIAVLTGDDIQPLWDALQAYQEVDSKFDRQRGIANVHQALAITRTSDLTTHPPRTITGPP
jgi:tetratricopeptide (TPR) repeat protein